MRLDGAVEDSLDPAEARPKRRAAIDAVNKMRSTSQAYREVDSDIRNNRYTEEELADRNRLALATPQCMAMCASVDRQCRRSGTCHHMGRYYCASHINVVTGNNSLNKRKREEEAAAVQKGCRHLLYELNSKCAICLEKMKVKQFCALKCGHFFHPTCLKNWRERSNLCPMCKRASGVLRPGNASYKVVHEIPLPPVDFN